ncbi:hypothetical protein [Polaribacter filamentus]|uniref:hypothetical protein n=1 Tax=Polaribacter filamentus TaxID=53483 RepID=UPI000CF279BA|nr:hypothetical protein [Polaribacter filamentus]
MSTVGFSECLAIINQKDKRGNSVPFDADVYSLNKNSKKGGVLKIYRNVKLLAWEKQERTLRGQIKAASTEVRSKRNPNHFNNRTRNIELANGEIKKIHLRLIDSINAKKVLP